MRLQLYIFSSILRHTMNDGKVAAQEEIQADNYEWDDDNYYLFIYETHTHTMLQRCIRFDTVAIPKIMVAVVAFLFAALVVLLCFK